MLHSRFYLSESTKVSSDVLVIQQMTDVCVISLYYIIVLDYITNAFLFKHTFNVVAG